MAITRLGNVLTFSSSANTSSSAVTVPSNTVLAMLGVAGYWDAHAATFSQGTISLAGITMSAAAIYDTIGTTMGAVLYTCFNPPAGAQTISWDWSGSEEVQLGADYFVTFWSGINSGDVFRCLTGQQNTGGAGDATTTNLTASSAGDVWIGLGHTWQNSPPDTHTWYPLSLMVPKLCADNQLGQTYTSWAEGSMVATTAVSITGSTDTQNSTIIGGVLKWAGETAQASAQFFSGGDELPHWDTTTTRYWPAVGSDRTSAGAAGATVRLPATVANNDTLILVCGYNDDTPAASGPAGWTSIQASNTTGNDRMLLFAYKYITDATGLGGATTAMGAGADPFNYWVAAVSGISSASPTEYFTDTSMVHYQNGTTMVCTAFTTVTPSAYAVAAMISNNDNATTAPSSPWTTEADDATDASSTLNVSTQIVGTSGTSTGSATWTGGDGAAEFSTGLVVFRANSSTISAHDGRLSAAAANASASLCGDKEYGFHFRVENTMGSTVTSAYKVQYYAASATTPAWTDVSSSSSTVRACATTDFVNGADVVEYLSGSLTYVTDNNAAIETSGGFQLTSGLPANNAFEGHLNFYLEETDVYDDDVIYLRVVKNDDTVLSYPITATIVANAIGARAVAKSIDCDGGSYAIAGQTATLQAARQLVSSAGSYNATGQAVALQRGLQLPIGAGSYAVAGQNITFPRTYVVVPAAGSYVVAGQTVSLELDRQLVPGAGSYTVNGQVVGLELDRQLVPDAGSYAVAGQTASLTRTFVIVPDAGSYVLDGQAVVMAKGQYLNADAGAYVIDGKTATLAFARQLVPALGEYTVEGQEVTLTYAPATAKELTAEGGSYAINGQAVALYVDRQLPIVAGSYAVAGQAVALQTARQLIPTAGSYVVAGQNVSLEKGVTLVPEAGSYAVAGQAVTLQMARQVVAANGTYTIAGQDAVLSKGAFIIMDAGSYAVAGQIVTFPRTYVLIPEAGAYTIDGKEVTLTYTPTAKSINAEAGSYAIGGQDVALQVDRRLDIDSGAYIVQGQDAILLADRQLIPGAGSYIIDGKDVGLRKDVTIVMGPGTYTVAGQNVGLELDRILVVGSGAYTIEGFSVTFDYSGVTSYYIKGIDIASGKFVYIKVLSTNLV